MSIKQKEDSTGIAEFDRMDEDKSGGNLMEHGAIRQRQMSKISQSRNLSMYVELLRAQHTNKKQM